jgi:hypothetical protein
VYLLHEKLSDSELALLATHSRCRSPDAPCIDLDGTSLGFLPSLSVGLSRGLATHLLASYHPGRAVRRASSPALDLADPASAAADPAASLAAQSPRSPRRPTLGLSSPTATRDSPSRAESVASTDHSTDRKVAVDVHGGFHGVLSGAGTHGFTLHSGQVANTSWSALKSFLTLLNIFFLLLL